MQHLPSQGESLPLPTVSMAAKSFPGSGFESVWRGGRGKSVPTDLFHVCPTADPLKLNLVSLSVLQTAVTAEGGL